MHTVGHWFGLLHVFEGGCTGTDYCDDTPAQAGPSYSHKSDPNNIRSCPAVDSCPQYPGTDNIFNFVSVIRDCGKSNFADHLDRWITPTAVRNSRRIKSHARLPLITVKELIEQSPPVCCGNRRFAACGEVPNAEVK
jgi:hypothetical protein